MFELLEPTAQGPLARFTTTVKVVHLLPIRGRYGRAHGEYVTRGGRRHNFAAVATLPRLRRAPGRRPGGGGTMLFGASRVDWDARRRLFQR